MAASLKVSELTALTTLAATDLLLVSDTSATTSKKATFASLESSLSLANLGTRTVNSLSDVVTTSPSNGQTLTWSSSNSRWENTTPADATQLNQIQTLTGIASGTGHFGGFSGGIIPDDLTLKTVLQHLETSVEAPFATEFNAKGTGHLKLRAVTGNDFNLYLANQETLQITRDPSTGNPKFTAKGGTGEFKFNQAITEPTFSGHAYSPEWRAYGTGHLKLRAETGNDLMIYLQDAEALQITRHASNQNVYFTAGGGSKTFVFNQAVDFAGGLSSGGTSISANTDAVIGAGGAAHLGTFTGSIIPDDKTVKEALQQLETTLSAVDIDTDDLAALTGIAENVTNLGTFTGSTIADNVAVKAALQALETATELRATAANARFTGITGIGTASPDADHPCTILGEGKYGTNGVLAIEDSTSVEAGNGGGITLKGIRDVAGNQTVYGGIRAKKDNATAGQFGAHIELVTRANGSGDPEVGFTVNSDQSCKTAGALNVAGALSIADVAITASAAELNYVDGVTSAIQTQLDAIQADVDQNESDADAAIAANEVHIDNAATLSGVAKDSTHLGTFTGATITDNQTVKAAIQLLETKVEAVQTDVDGNESDADTAIALKANIASPTFTTKIESPEFHAVDSHLKFKCDTNDIVFYPNNTETLQITRSGTDCRFTSNGGSGTFKFNQITEFAAGVKLDSVSLTTVQSSGEAFADNDTSLMTSAAIEDRIATTAATTVTKASLDVDHLITLSGVSAAADDLGTFTGSTIADSQTIKVALQSLETKVEAVQTDVDGNESDADTAIALKAPIAGPTFTGTLAAPTINASTALQVGGAAITSTPAELNVLDGLNRGHIIVGNSSNAPTSLAEGSENEVLTIDSNGDAVWAAASGSTSKADLDVDHLITLSGVSDAADDLGTFTGSTITDAQTIKAAIQLLETALELRALAASPTITGNAVFSGIVTAADDTAAAAAGVPVNGIYRVAGAGLMKCRIS